MSSTASGAQTPTEDSSESAQPDAEQPRHRRLGTVGLIALLVCVIVGVAAGVTAWLTHGFDGTVTVRYQQAAVFSAQVGDCINLTPNGAVVHVVPCAAAHDAEVFGTFHLSGDKWPGTAAIRQEASSGCAIRLAGYLNPQLAATNLAQSYVYPGQQAWDAGERTVVCEVRSTSGTLTGSVRSGSSVSGGD
jgi:Septum formation